ncbi:alpha/beta fold hydrolase [Bacillus solitudinis]|uniref:alpha/beta fold hydrolase n=1 Tax=Bacillus solitudinis TaxID=2014074 RepID=UPI000C24DA42|nr:alpha/beta hydrolase [Bacillus solitudinis]
MPYARGKGPAIYYEVEGTGTPIVFLHPPGMGHVTFNQQRRLSSFFQIVFLDFRGNGRSGRTKERVTVSSMAEDVLQVIDKLQLEKVVVCGYSNGSSVAQEFALTYPERTSGVLLCGGFPEVNTFFLEKEFDIGIFGAKHKWMPLFGQILSKSHFKEKPYVQFLKNYVKETNPINLESAYEEGLAYSCLDRIQNLKVPLLLIYGSRDFYLHVYQWQYAKRVKDLEIIHVSKATHQIPTKQPDEFNAILKNWVERKIAKQTQQLNL